MQRDTRKTLYKNLFEEWKVQRRNNALKLVFHMGVCRTQPR